MARAKPAPKAGAKAVKAEFKADRDELLGFYRDMLLIQRFEGSRAAPWKVGLTASRLDAMVGAIIGFRIRVKRIDVKLKLSQNRSREDRERVIAGLASEGYAEASATAEWMRAFAADA